MFSSIVQQIDADGMSYVDKMAALSTFIECVGVARCEWRRAQV